MRGPYGVSLLVLMCLSGSADLIADETLAEPLSHATAVPLTELESTRGQGGGGGFLQLNDMDLDANLNNNFIQSSTSGNNAISHGAFSDSSGFATVIQNSGNHVIIQNATIVNLKLGE
ncbi:hypothetical protein Tel_12645 [Candidatus Tenderia electrophaga]|jgi:hypothetical protein|uniref:Filamentous haemagglutinin FhaB/tRNA nuclease CdiA-like TPS domain-containing protein n=1 Tax=Candidatus Tenderia electrophaga TaxID=1748243 RepID=A0A0S2TFK0_9GAMM|nr:hypothetical protein Tel_12645 [Candidatus Tenderia electrophaga]